MASHYAYWIRCDTNEANLPMHWFEYTNPAIRWAGARGSEGEFLEEKLRSLHECGARYLIRNRAIFRKGKYQTVHPAQILPARQIHGFFLASP